MANTVKFLHPGGEWKIEEEDCGIAFWRLRGAGHTRRFIRTPGRFLREMGGTAHEDEIGFWGEYEAPTRFERLAPRGRRIQRTAGLPTFVHEPFPLADVIRPFGALNTDPFVLGPLSIYSNCQQRSSPALRNLGPGDVVFFGSLVRGLFVLDTVFVVASNPIEYIAGHARTVIGDQVPDHIHELALDLVEPGKYALYKGATYENPVNDMFSFVPCLPLADAPHGFARPAAPPPLQSRQGRKFKAKGFGDPYRYWTDTAQVVLESSLCLGVSMTLP